MASHCEHSPNQTAIEWHTVTIGHSHTHTRTHTHSHTVEMWKAQEQVYSNKRFALRSSSVRVNETFCINAIVADSTRRKQTKTKQCEEQTTRATTVNNKIITNYLF
eukprot:m.135115 g.135115  ORF g.135115 m.135115 type:complete len:106 (-) comp13972_c1_seq3:5330-5647(-)